MLTVRRNLIGNIYGRAAGTRSEEKGNGEEWLEREADKTRQDEGKRWKTWKKRRERRKMFFSYKQMAAKPTEK